MITGIFVLKTFPNPNGYFCAENFSKSWLNIWPAFLYICCAFLGMWQGSLLMELLYHPRMTDECLCSSYRKITDQKTWSVQREPCPDTTLCITNCTLSGIKSRLLSWEDSNSPLNLWPTVSFINSLNIFVWNLAGGGGDLCYVALNLHLQMYVCMWFATLEMFCASSAV